MTWCYDRHPKNAIAILPFNNLSFLNRVPQQNMIKRDEINESRALKIGTPVECSYHDVNRRFAF